MNDSLTRGEAARPRRESAAADLGANAGLQDGEMIEVHPRTETPTGPDRLGVAGVRMDRRNSILAHHRHMPMEPLKFHIPRKTKDNRALFQYVSTESREYEDMLTILTSSYIDASSAGCFTYCQPRLVHSDLLEKEFVEKRREMKADGRTDKELEESYCFLIVDTDMLHLLCEKGLIVGHSWITVLGNPKKGVYLSRYSDLLQMNGLTPGTTGEIVIFKVMKGKVKSIYENMKNLLDPTPRFDSHISKNSCKVTSLNSYRAYELTQQYFYEYLFDELRQRPRQVCPYAVISFHFKGKDSSLPSKPLAPIRLNSQSSEASKERAQYTVWTGDLVRGNRVLFQISLRSFSPPLLPHRIPEKLDIGCLMRLDQVTKVVPSVLFSYNLYNSSQEVMTSGYCCSLLEVIDRSRSTTSVTRLLQELEMKRVVLVTHLTERGFLFLLSSVQMATPTERGENWKRCLQALFVFPESRAVVRSTSSCTSQPSLPGATVMPRLNRFIPALHHALIKARANPPPELSAGVEHQVREYFIGLNDGKGRQYPMGEYDSKLDERGKMFPAPRHHRVNMDGYLRSYLYSPTFYLLSVACARQVMEAHCGSEEQQEIQQLIDLVLTCKRNAENEVNREEAGLKAPGRKRRLEQETAERTLKFLRASQAPGRREKIPVEGNQVSASPGSLESVISSVGLKDIDLRNNGSELAARLLSLLTGLSQAASGTATQSLGEGQDDGQRESPFDKLATKLGLPTNCDIDLRRQEDLEEQTGSISSLEGFSPSSHSGETNHHGAARGGGQGRREGANEEEDDEQWQIPWVLIPITGLCSERYTHRDRNIPQDPRFQHLATATSVTTTTEPPRRSPTPSPQPSLPPSPLQCLSQEPSPAPSPSQCLSPDPSSPPSPSQCPSPEPSSPPSPSDVLSLEPSPPTSTPKCPSPQPSPPISSSQCPSPPSPSHCQSPKSNEFNPLDGDQSGVNKKQLVTRESTAVSICRNEKPQGKQKKNEPSILASVRPCIPSASDRKMSSSPPLTEQRKENAGATAREVADVTRELKGKDVAKDSKHDVEAIDLIDEMAYEKEQKEQTMGLAGASVFPSSVSSSFSVRAIDSIVDKHLGDFSSEVQLLLQEQSIHYNVPQSPHSTSNTETTEHQHVPPHTSISQFSQYVSFYNPCPPVQDYVLSLQNSINSMLMEFERKPSHKAGATKKDADAALANSVSAFVAGIRAGNATTDKDDEVSASGELMAAEVCASDSRIPESWQPDTVSKQFLDASNKISQTAHVTLPVPTSATPTFHSPQIKPLLPHWQQSGTLEINRTVTQNTDRSQGNSTIRTSQCTTGAEAGSTRASLNCETTLPGVSVDSKHLAEPSHSSKPVSCSASVSVPGNGTNLVPQATALSSLINQLQPEVFSSLVEIIKDVKRNSLQFYLHSTEPEDPFYKDVTELLLKQGNTELNPLAFLSQETSDDRLLVIIRNKDISAHIHKIPGLMSLKRHRSVVFVGIDTMDDIRNNSYIELFVSGGCIISDELVLNPDLITHDRLASLLMFLEQHSSPECVWKWKVHCKTHKKLKEQARFRRDAANILEVLSTYQRRQIVEFLPYHHCDMMNHQSPDLDCLIELQGRYTQYRHTVFLTEHQFEKFAAYSGSGIIVASIKEILQDFSRLVGHHDTKDKQPITNDLLAPKGLSRQLNQCGAVSGSETSACIFPEHISSLSCCDQPPQPGSGLPSLPHRSDQLVPDGSSKDIISRHSDTDFEALRRAISQLRAERQAQLQQQHLIDSQTDCIINPLKNPLPDPVHVGSDLTSSPPSQVGPSESVQLTHGRKAVAATLDLIHSALHPEPVVQEKVSCRITPPVERQRKAAAGKTDDQRDGIPVKALGLLRGIHGTSKSDASTPPSITNAAALAGPASNQPDSTSDGTEKADQQGEPALPDTDKHSRASSSAATCSGDKPRDAHSDQEQPSGAEAPGNSTPVTQHLQSSNQQQHIHEQLHIPQRHSLQQHPPQHQWGMGLLRPPHIAQLPSQPFPPGHMMAPLTSLRGIRSILGPTPVWTGGLSPAGALVWRIPQAGTSASILRGYHNPGCGQGSSRYRGGQRGGGFNGM